MASQQKLETTPLPLSVLPIKPISKKICLITLKAKAKHRSTFTMDKNVSMLQLKKAITLPSKALSLNSPTSTVVLSRMFANDDRPLTTVSSPSLSSASSSTSTSQSTKSCLNVGINKMDYNGNNLNDLATNSWSVIESIPTLTTICKESLDGGDDVTSTTTTTDITTTTIATKAKTAHSDNINNRLKSNTILTPTQQKKFKTYKIHSNCSVYDETLTLPVDAVLFKNKCKSLTYKNINSTSLNHRTSDKNKVVKVFFVFYLIHQLKLWYRFLVTVATCSRSSSSTSSSSLLQKNNSLVKKEKEQQQQQQIIELRKLTRSLSSSSSMPSSNLTMKKNFRLLPRVGTTSFCALITIICLETILLSTMSSCAKTFYMHWNTSNSIFRIDNTDHIIDVNKGNLAFEFDQVHIICPVYEPGTFDNATEKYIIYNVSKVEYETCRITNADPRVIAICDKPQKLMFFTITFRPFTPQPGGLEFLPGNDYYFISTSSKDDLYRRIGGRCTTNNMKVVFKVCCAPEEKNKTTISPQVGTRVGGVNDGSNSGADSGHGVHMGATDVNGGGGGLEDSNISANVHNNNKMNMIGIKGLNGNTLPEGVLNIHNGGGGMNNNGLQINPIMNSLGGTAINTNIEQFNRIPIQPNNINILGNTIGSGLGGTRSSIIGGGNSGINMMPGAGNSGGTSSINDGGQYHPSHDYHGQSGIRINNVPSPHHTNFKNNDEHHYNKHPNEVVKNEELTYNSGSIITLSMISRIFSVNQDLTGRNRRTYNLMKETTYNIMPVSISSINIDYYNYLWNNFKLLVINYRGYLLPSFFLTNPMISSLLIIIIIQGIFKHIILNNTFPFKCSLTPGTNNNNSSNDNRVHRSSCAHNHKNRMKLYKFHHRNNTTIEMCKIRQNTR